MNIKIELKNCNKIEKLKTDIHNLEIGEKFIFDNQIWIVNSLTDDYCTYITNLETGQSTTCARTDHKNVIPIKKIKFKIKI